MTKESIESTMCPACRDIFSELKTLNCGHSLCHKCIDQMYALEYLKQPAILDENPPNKSAENFSIECPTCKATIPCTVTQLLSSKFLPNETLSQYCNKLRKTGRLCDSSCGNRSTVKCVDCDISLCDQCFDSVHQIDAMKRHIRVNNGQESFNKCLKHKDMKLELYCQDCEQVICYRCSVFTELHKNHRCVPIDNSGRKEYLSSIAINEKLIRLQIDEFKDTQKSIEKTMAELSSVHEIINNRINQEFNKIIAAAEIRKKQLLMESEEIQKEKKLFEVKRLSSQLSSVNVVIGKLEMERDTAAADIRNEGCSVLKLAETKQHTTHVIKIMNDDKIRLSPVCDYRSQINLNLEDIKNAITVSGVITPFYLVPYKNENSTQKTVQSTGGFLGLFRPNTSELEPKVDDKPLVKEMITEFRRHGSLYFDKQKERNSCKLVLPAKLPLSEFKCSEKLWALADIGSGFIAYHGNNRINILNIHTKSIIRSFGSFKSVVDMIAIGRNCVAIACLGTPKIDIYNWQLGELVDHVIHPQGLNLEWLGSSQYLMTFGSGSVKYLAVCGWSDKTVRFFRLGRTSKLLETITGHDYVVNCMEILTQGRLATGSERTIKIWKLKNSTIQCETTMICKGRVYALRLFGEFSLASAGGDNDPVVRLWDLNTHKCIMTVGAHNGPVTQISLIGSNHILTASEDHTMKVWDLTKCECVMVAKGHTHFVNRAIITDEDLIVSCSSDSTIKIWTRLSQ